MASETAEKILKHLNENDECSTLQLAALWAKDGIDHQKIVGAVKSLQSLANV